MPLTVRLSHRVRNLDTLFDFTPREADAALDTLDDMVRAYEVEQFATEGRSGGKGWSQLSPGYKIWKMQVRPGRKILVFDGILRASLTTTSSPFHVKTWSRSSSGGWILRSGSRDPKGIKHQTFVAPKVERKPMQFMPHQIAAIRSGISNTLIPFVKQRFRALASMD